MDIDKIEKIECTYPDYDYDGHDEDDYDNNPHLIGELKVIDRRLEEKRLILTTVDNKEFYFVKSTTHNWSHSKGFLIDRDNYPKEDVPNYVRILNN